VKVAYDNFQNKQRYDDDDDGREEEQKKGGVEKEGKED